MAPHTQTGQAAGQAGLGPLHGPGQQGVEADRARGEDDGRRAVVESAEGGRVQADRAQLVGCVVQRVVGSLGTQATREQGVVQL